MKIDILLGMQFGSEAKGSVISQLVQRKYYDASIRVQSIQAGHTVYFGKTAYKMRTIPCAWVNPSVQLILGPGCFIERDLLLDEIRFINGAMPNGDVRDRLFVDKRVFEVVHDDVLDEVSHNIENGIGSTAHGCGASLIRKIWRDKGNSDLIKWLTDNGINVVDTIVKANFEKMNILVEGCQGTMLSLHTSPYYPFVTSREATASGIIAECGFSPRDVRDIIGVFRTYPIRVGGNSGDTGSKELSWDLISSFAGVNVTPERTTVTNRVRRIFEFSDSDFAHACMVNKPTKLYMTFANYMVPCYHAQREDDIYPEYYKILSNFMDHVESLSGDARIVAFNTGEFDNDWIYEDKVGS
jgi:adenylosuccinate synthase